MSGCSTQTPVRQGNDRDWISQDIQEISVLPGQMAQENSSDEWVHRSIHSTNQDSPILVQEIGRHRGTSSALPTPMYKGAGLFRNTYYHFPQEESGARDVTLFNTQCVPIAEVSNHFYQQLCVQGSGQIASRDTVSFAKRDCTCAATCARTNQKICFEKLSPKEFPFGRGASGKALVPFRSVAVDASVIPLGTWIWIQEWSGVRLPDGTAHTGCFEASDQGLWVKGDQVDIFVGDENSYQWANRLVPTNVGVHVVLNDSRCGAR